MSELCAARNTPTAEGLPDKLMLRLLKVLCGIEQLQPIEARSVQGRFSTNSEPTFGTAEVYSMIDQVEHLKGTIMNDVRLLTL